MPYQVFGSRSGAAAVTVRCTRSASARSSGAIPAILSRTAWSPSAFLAPFLPSARSSAARSFIAARSSAVKPSDAVLALFAGMCGLPLDVGPGAAPGHLRSTLGPPGPRGFSIPDRLPARRAASVLHAGGHRPQLEGLHRLRSPLEVRGPERAHVQSETGPRARRSHGPARDGDAARAGETLQPGGDVGGVADHGEGALRTGTDVPDHGDPRVHAHAE